jgi:hypothetical protein
MIYFSNFKELLDKQFTHFLRCKIWLDIEFGKQKNPAKKRDKQFTQFCDATIGSLLTYFSYIVRQLQTRHW